MSASTRDKIVASAHTSGGVRPHDLALQLGLSRTAIHRHLSALVLAGVLERRGKPPRVRYFPAPQVKATPQIQIPPEQQAYLEDTYCYFMPNGKELRGLEGFLTFLERTNQDAQPLERIEEFLDIRRKADSFRDSTGLIDGLSRLETVFPGEVQLDYLYYSDFYSLPKYGKTLLGHYLLHGKSGQNYALIQRIAGQTKDHVATVVKQHRIDAIAFAPHSIPRSLPFLKEYRALLNLGLPEIKLEKIFSGDVPIAQKSLSKLRDRVENARTTIFGPDTSVTVNNLLVIDDAMGSGATLNEIARKFRGQAKQIVGYVVVGSYKGFEVINEV